MPNSPYDPRSVEDLRLLFFKHWQQKIDARLLEQVGKLGLRSLDSVVRDGKTYARFFKDPRVLRRFTDDLSRFNSGDDGVNRLADEWREVLSHVLLVAEAEQKDALRNAEAYTTSRRPTPAVAGTSPYIPGQWAGEGFVDRGPKGKRGRNPDTDRLRVNLDPEELVAGMAKRHENAQKAWAGGPPSPPKGYAAEAAGQRGRQYVASNRLSLAEQKYLAYAGTRGMAGAAWASGERRRPMHAAFKLPSGKVVHIPQTALTPRALQIWVIKNYASNAELRALLNLTAGKPDWVHADYGYAPWFSGNKAPALYMKKGRKGAVPPGGSDRFVEALLSAKFHAEAMSARRQAFERQGHSLSEARRYAEAMTLKQMLSPTAARAERRMHREWANAPTAAEMGTFAIGSHGTTPITEIQTARSKGPRTPGAPMFRSREEHEYSVARQRGKPWADRPGDVGLGYSGFASYRRDISKWSREERAVIPYGKFKGMMLGDLVRPYKTTHYTRRGRKLEKRHEEAVYYLAGMGDSDKSRRDYPQFFREHDRFVEHPWVQELLRPYQEVNFLGGRSPADLAIHRNDYKPETWEHGHSVSLRDDDPPYYDRWEGYERAHRHGYDIRKLKTDSLPGDFDRELADEHFENMYNYSRSFFKAQLANTSTGAAREREEPLRVYRQLMREARGEKARWAREQAEHYVRLGRIEAAPMRFDPKGLMVFTGRGRQYDPEGNDEQGNNQDDPFGGGEAGRASREMHDSVRPVRKRHMRVGRSRDDAEETELASVKKMNYAQKMADVVVSGGTLEQLQAVVDEVEEDVGWPALDEYQGLLDPWGATGNNLPEYPEDPKAEIYDTDSSLRAFAYRCKAVIMARG